MISAICLQRKNDTITTFKSAKETLGKGSQESSASTNKTNENEVKIVHPQLAEIQRKKPVQRDQDFLWIT